jgi:pimeloyl-ACP methyl ester carboxylesterase
LNRIKLSYKNEPEFCYLERMKKLKIFFASLFAIIIATGIYFYVVFRINNPETKEMNADARKNTGGQFIQLPAGITHYEAGGPDTGKVVVLVHGFSVPYHIWNGTYDSLVKKGFHVIRYDEFGRGFSDRPDVVYSPMLYRKQLFDLITSLKLKTPLNLMGVSFGGAVVTDFAVHYPQLVNKIILIDPVYKFGKKNEPAFITNYKMAAAHEKQAAGQLEDFKYPERFPGWADKYKVQMQYKGFRHALISTMNNYPGDSILSNYRLLDGLQKKILLIWGKEDKTVPFQYSDSLKQIVKADFFAVDDAGHLPYLEQPSSANQKIISFLKE